MPRHKHADLIHAWAEGAEIQTRRDAGEMWTGIEFHGFSEHAEYRIKPRTVKREGWVQILKSQHGESSLHPYLYRAEAYEKHNRGDDYSATVKIEWEEEE